MVQEIQIFRDTAVRVLDLSHSLICLSASVVVEILVVYFGKIMRFDVLAVVTVEH